MGVLLVVSYTCLTFAGLPVSVCSVLACFVLIARLLVCFDFLFCVFVGLCVLYFLSCSFSFVFDFFDREADIKLYELGTKADFGEVRGGERWPNYILSKLY